MTHKSRAVAIVPCSDLDAAEQWWEQLGFTCPAGRQHEGYRMLTDAAGAEVHLTTAVPGWLTPERNPFGIYLYTARVEEIAQAVRDDIIEKQRRPEHKPWGMYEFALNGPDDLLVRVGWPSPAHNASASELGGSLAEPRP